MIKKSEMLFLVMSLLYWSQAKGGCSGAIVSISGDRELSAGDGFNLSCQFTCLRAQHVAQLWRKSPHEGSVSLVNITSMLPNVTLVLSVSCATKTDTGHYYCKTQPPDTISPVVSIQIADNLTTSSTPRCDGSQQHSSVAGLQGQIWYWILLGKTAILLLSLAYLAVKCKRG
ncbi:uncharacterized protein LOC144527052 isoform X2 [Sander vitreus]